MKIANRILTVVALSSCLAPMAMATPRSNFKAPAASSAATSIPASPRLAHAKALPSQRVKHGKQNAKRRVTKSAASKTTKAGARNKKVKA